jgi:deoxyribose-phosphate aldolase
MSFSEQASIQAARDRAGLCRVLELILRRPDLTSAELQSGCAAAQALNLAGVCVASSRLLQAATFLEDSTVRIICSIGAPAMDSDVKRYETEVAVDAGAHIIELTPNLGRLRDGENALVLRELRDVVEAADERPVRVLLPIEIFAALGSDCLRALTEDSGVCGLVLVCSGAADAETVKRARASLNERLSVKLECPGLAWAQVVSLHAAGADRFATALGAEVLQEP